MRNGTWTFLIEIIFININNIMLFNLLRVTRLYTGHTFNIEYYLRFNQALGFIFNLWRNIPLNAKKYIYR